MNVWKEFRSVSKFAISELRDMWTTKEVGIVANRRFAIGIAQ